MKISFFTPFEITKAITGGQIYDKKLLKVLSDSGEHSVSTISLSTKTSKKFPPFAPLCYLNEALKDKESEIVITNSAVYMRFALLPYFLKKLRGKKLFTVHHHFMYRAFTGLKRKIYKYFEWNYLQSMDKIIAASPYVYDDLKRRIPEEKLILHKIPFNTTAITTTKPEIGNLTFTGTIEERKGLHLLMQSLALLKHQGKDYPLTIIGKVVDNDYFSNLKKYIEENRLNVRFTGFIETEEMDNILSTTDVFVFPSLLEGYGMALVEAQVYGLPIVSFDNSAMPYTVRDGENGFCVETGDIKAFANAIQKIVENRDLRTQLSQGAYDNLKRQNTEEKFSKDIIRDFRE